MNSGQPGTGQEPRKLATYGVKNPYILQFCRILVEKKGEHLEPEAMEKLLRDMYALYENMLGQNMVKALPPEVRAKYLGICEDLSQLDYETIGEIFDRHIPHYEAIMKETMQEFAKVFLENRMADVKGSAGGESAATSEQAEA